MHIQATSLNGLLCVSQGAELRVASLYTECINEGVCEVVKCVVLFTMDQPARLASKQAWPISSFNSSFSSAMASPTATKRLTAPLTAWPTLWMAREVFSVFFSLSLWLIRVVIWNEREAFGEICSSFIKLSVQVNMQLFLYASPNAKSLVQFTNDLKKKKRFSQDSYCICAYVA